jgi:predicted dehydrogenase
MLSTGFTSAPLPFSQFFFTYYIMRFALLGDHPDGLDLARALVATGHHELASYTGTAVGLEYLHRFGLRFTPSADLEEVLADPAIAAVIVAGPLAERPTQLRRALQSERHVLCVHPADTTPDLAYEAAMLQGDTKCILLPLLPEALHPGVRRFVELIQHGTLGTLLLLEMERHAPEAVALAVGTSGHRLALPGWDTLRAVGGEIAEVSGYAAGEELAAEQPLLLAGRFERGGLFRTILLPGQPEPFWKVTAVGGYGRAELTFPTGWPGEAVLRWPDETGTLREQTWEAGNPWPPVVEVFDTAVAAATARTAEGETPVQTVAGPLTWQTAIRALELDDATRRSIERRRVSTLEYPEPSEEVGFKGTMTLVGCGLLWVILLLVILAAWVPWLRWVILPILAFFLGLQILRWLVPSAPERTGQHRPSAPEDRSQGPDTSR